MQATDWDGGVENDRLYQQCAEPIHPAAVERRCRPAAALRKRSDPPVEYHRRRRVSATIAFQKSYSNPVIVAYIVTRNGGESVDVLVAQVTESGCMLFLEEPDDEGHAPELVGYLVMEAGAYSLEDGTQVEAGTVTTASVHREWDAFDGESVAFSQAFSVPPVLLYTLKTYQNGEFMSSVSPSVSAAGFTIQQEAVGSGAFSASETIDWIAIEAGKSGNSRRTPL